MISFISSLESINGVMSDTNMFLRTSASVADVAAVSPNDVKILLANGLSTFFIVNNPVFGNDP